MSGDAAKRTTGVRGRVVVASVLTASAVAFGLSTSSVVATASTRYSGPVDVLYAGSLLDLMQHEIDPAFHRATGYTVNGIPNGSSALATEIKNGTEVADVFISASPSVDAQLHGASNGNWISSYWAFGRSALVLGYNPSSRFADALRRGPWYDVVDRRGFLLGRTDPATDPKGVLAVAALTGAARQYHHPRLAALAASTSNVFTETSLVGELEAGQLDAGFFYAVEASAAHLRTVALEGTRLSGTYTVALVNRAPDGAGARAFVRFLLSGAGRRILSRSGITPIVPARRVSSSGSKGSFSLVRRSTTPTS